MPRDYFSAIEIGQSLRSLYKDGQRYLWNNRKKHWYESFNKWRERTSNALNVGVENALHKCAKYDGLQIERFVWI